MCVCGVNKAGKHFQIIVKLENDQMNELIESVNSVASPNRSMECHMYQAVR